MKKLLLALFFAVSLAAHAQTTTRATAQLQISIVIPPTLDVRSATPVEGGTQYSGVTNLKSAYLGGQLVTFGKPGPFSVFVPSASSLQTERTLFTDGASYTTITAP